MALDSKSQAQVLAEYEAAAESILKALGESAQSDGLVPITELQTVIGKTNLALQALRTAQLALIEGRIGDAAVIGASAIADLVTAAANDEFPADLVSRLPVARNVAHEITQQAIHNIGDDGLQLSDRIWRIDKGLREQLLPKIQAAIATGETARNAARGALIAGGKATAEQLNQIEMASAGVLGKDVTRIFTGDQATAYANTLRVMRTEIDNAHILASRAALYNTEGVVGTRFLLSPNHPRFDICDLHASVNLYGLGPGVYPPGKSPLPAHPNTLSYEEAVFSWELDPAHQAQRDDPVSWLLKQDAKKQEAVLQSADKVRVLRSGQLQSADITKPWREIQGKYSPDLSGQSM